MRLTHLAMIAFCLLMLSCSKKNEPKADTPPKLTTDIITQSYNSQRVWELFSMQETYLNASGGVDSTFEKGPIFNWQADPQEIRFFIGKDVTTGQTDAHLLNLYASGTLDRVIPGIGKWQLSADGKSLTITQHPSFPDKASGGTFDVFYNSEADSVNGFPYPQAMGLSMTQSLSGNRQVQIKINLGSN